MVWNRNQPQVKKDYQFIVSDVVAVEVDQYLQDIIDKKEVPGARLKALLAGKSLSRMSKEEFLDLLIQTKKPTIFAESELKLDGSDWNMREVGLLGGVLCAVPVEIYDNGAHAENIKTHGEEFSGMLLFAPGALLTHGPKAKSTPDIDRVIKSDGTVDQEAYYRLYEERILPMLLHANEDAKKTNQKAFVAIPGMGCGVFAGKDNAGNPRRLEGELEDVIRQILIRHSDKLDNIGAVYFDPYRKEIANKTESVNNIDFLVRPLLNGNQDKPQLCRPEHYNPKYKDYKSYSMVAWDHVSWPGNDAYKDSRSTDDGVKAMATNVMAKMTGVLGRGYDAITHKFLSPKGFTTWENVINKSKIKLRSGQVKVAKQNGELINLQDFKAKRDHMKSLQQIHATLETYARSYKGKSGAVNISRFRLTSEANNLLKAFIQAKASNAQNTNEIEAQLREILKGKLGVPNGDLKVYFAKLTTLLDSMKPTQATPQLPVTVLDMPPPSEPPPPIPTTVQQIESVVAEERHQMIELLHAANAAIQQAKQLTGDVTLEQLKQKEALFTSAHTKLQEAENILLVDNQLQTQMTTMKRELGLLQAMNHVQMREAQPVPTQDLRNKVADANQKIAAAVRGLETNVRVMQHKELEHVHNAVHKLLGVLTSDARVFEKQKAIANLLTIGANITNFDSLDKKEQTALRAVVAAIQDLDKQFGVIVRAAKDLKNAPTQDANARASSNPSALFSNAESKNDGVQPVPSPQTLKR